MFDRLYARRNPGLSALRRSGRGFDLGTGHVALPLDPGFPYAIDGIFRKGLTKFIQRDLVAAGTCIEYEDLHDQYGQVQFLTSGISSPCSCTYCVCSTSLSRRNCSVWIERKSFFSVCRAISPMAPASSTSVGLAPTMTKAPPS